MVISLIGLIRIVVIVLMIPLEYVLLFLHMWNDSLEEVQHRLGVWK